MTKQIVSKIEIAADPALTLIKAFRIANKRAGEAKRAAAQPDLNEEQQEELITTYRDYCTKMQQLAEKSEAEYNFNIWVNFNGRTGHTYEKDYKVSSERDNDFELHQSNINSSQNAVNDLLDSLGSPEDDDPMDDEPNLN